MKILISGALGHVGSYIIRALPKKILHSKIYLIDNLQSQRYCSLFGLKNFNYEFHNIDLSKEIFNKKADLVIHLAAKTDAAQSHTYKKEFEKNLNITKNIIKYCQKHNSKLIFASSTSVYGPQKDTIDEDCHKSELNPQSPYASIKLKEERLIRKKLINNKYLILRLGTIYGFSQGIRFQTAVNKFCFQAALNEPLTVWKTAYNQKRPYLGLSDFASALCHIIKNDIFNNQIYNIVTENFKVSEIIKFIKSYDSKLKVKYVDHPIMNQLSYSVKNDKFKNTKFIFKSNIQNEIVNTLKQLKYLKN